MRLNVWWIVALPSLPLCQSHPLNQLDALQQSPSNQLLEAAKLLQAAEELQHFHGKLPSAKPSEPQRPRVPRRFRADTKFWSNPAMAAVGPGMFAQDADEKVLRIEEVRSFPFGKQYFSNLLLATEAYTITGGNHSICRQLPMFGMQKFVDIFAWAANPLLSEYAGERTVAGRGCSQWQLRSKNHSLSLCADGDIPVELNMSSSISGIPSATSYQFGPLVTGDQVPQSLFVKPAACEELAPPCESGRGKGPVLLEAYVFHPAMSTGDYNIEDQDIADLEGDAFFICADRMMNQSSSTIDHNYTRISHYLLRFHLHLGNILSAMATQTQVRPALLALVVILAWWAKKRHSSWEMVRAGVWTRALLAFGSACPRPVVAQRASPQQHGCQQWLHLVDSEEAEDDPTELSPKGAPLPRAVQGRYAQERCGPACCLHLRGPGFWGLSRCRRTEEDVALVV